MCSCGGVARGDEVAVTVGERTISPGRGRAQTGSVTTEPAQRMQARTRPTSPAVALAATIAMATAVTPATRSLAQDHRFVDATDAVGLGPEVVGTGVARAIFADVNADGWPDVIVNRHRVFLNLPDGTRAEGGDSPDGGASAPAPSPIGRRFVEVPECGLPTDDVANLAVVFADLDNDGSLDAFLGRNLDYHHPTFVDRGLRTGWMRGHGDGRFGPELQTIPAAPPATTIAVAVADVDLDGRLDLFLGNSYVAYGASYDAFSNDLLMQAAWPIENAAEGEPSMRWTWMRRPLPSDGEPFIEDEDLGGRPSYGVLIAWLEGDARAPHLLELSYGRRWNRAWEAAGPEDAPTLRFRDVAPALGIDGDAIRHGLYPESTKVLFRERYNVEREDEKPFRANGNTFDMSVGDIDDDGDFDLFITEITHGWAGDSSDRSRFLVNQASDRGRLGFLQIDEANVDRVPADTDRWNQGDLFSALADLDQDGHLDLLISSGDYPDNQRLRYYRGTGQGTFVDMTSAVGLDHDGSQQLSLADVDLDGDLDIIVGQTFFRYTAEMREGREPRLRLFLNEPPADHHSLTIRLRGSEAPVVAAEGGGGEPGMSGPAIVAAGSVNRDALGTIVRATIECADGSVTTMQRQVVGIGGHAGKQDDFLVHFGLGLAERVRLLEIVWPNRERTMQSFEEVPAGRYTLPFNGELSTAD